MASLISEGETTRARIEIQGAVQGVGFRPFVYRLAAGLGLTGWVINDARGVFIEVEGSESDLDAFVRRLRHERPALAQIHSLDVHRPLPAVGYESFTIRHSDDQGAKSALVLPDVATCPDCLAELVAPADRRHGYAFTNCTNCGPRFSIITALPYDRPNTTMHGFTMCPRCQGEYDSPDDRRFHAQPNACPVCGPQLELWSANGEVLARRDEALAGAAQALREGVIVAVKGIGGFLLMADARNEEAIAKLRRLKPRLDKPFAVMAGDMEQARQLCTVEPAAEALLLSTEAPIVLLPRRQDAPIAATVAPGNPNIGVMLPYAPLHHLLLRAVGSPVVATSGNLADEPICTDEREAVQRLGRLADRLLVHDRPIARHVDDSVAWVIEGESRLLRRARGFAPLPTLARRDLPTLLAVGAHLKNAIALSVGRQVFISQHIGDLETTEAMGAFERVIADLQRMYATRPDAIAHDLHPDYLSTRWAEQQGLPLVGVQHHHAHLAACLADNGSEAPALGVTWDGTGYGPDGTVWGGEFLLGDATGYRRVAHLRSFRLPGGETAVREPRRSAWGLLWEMGLPVLEANELAPLSDFCASDRHMLAQMLERGLNSPATTSAGRLFDGVAALIGLRQTTTYEGQAAMELEFACDPSVGDAYELSLRENSGSLVLDWQPMLEALLVDLHRGVAPGVMAVRFHNGLADAIVRVAQAIGTARVALSGGCFQNRRLTESVARRLGAAGFEVLLHRQTPPNDGCIALGQIMVAAARLT